MQEMINFLIQNPEVVEKVQQGAASLIGLSEVEVKAVIEIFKETAISATITPYYYWH